MAKIAFLLLAHRDPKRLIDKVKALTAHGDCVAVHFDARAASADWRTLKQGLADLPNVTLAKRIRCGWGEYSLVQATLNLIDAARRQFTEVTHYYLISGDCYPTKSRGYFERYLKDDKDYIENKDFFESGWIKTGLKEDRLIYRHWFNERERKWLFYTSLNLQRRFGFARPLPDGLSMRIGSQWWVLRAKTIERLVAFLKKRPDIPRFFRTTWIPDETFFQTVVAHLVPREEIRSKPPTHLRFSDYGMPVVFYRNHADYLRAEDAPFARKVSSDADAMHDLLLGTFRAWDAQGPEGGANSNLYGYLAGRGRQGVRYAPRFWEAAIGRRKRTELLLLTAKMWHIGEAIQKAAASAANVRALGYVFDDDKDLDVPLGGLESGLAKRNRHRRALLNLLFDALDTDRLMLCIDPGQAAAMAEMAENFGTVRILLVDRPVPRSHIHGHAMRTGLIGHESGAFEEQEAMRALEHEFASEVENLREAHDGRLFVNNLDRTRDDNVLDLARFLRIGRAAAEGVAREAERWRR